MRWLYMKKGNKRNQMLTNPTADLPQKNAPTILRPLDPHISSQPESKVWDSDQVRIIQPKHINTVRIWYSVVFEKELESRENNMWENSRREG